MTDPVPAAAPGLPAFDRRAFLATLAAAGVMSVGAEPPNFAADHPDAPLLAMVALHASHVAREHAFDVLMKEACRQFVSPAIPEALRWRPSDFMSVCFDRARLSVFVIDGRETHVYEDRGCLEGLAEITALRQADPGQYSFCRGDIARAEELFAAMDAYEADIARAEAAAGITAAVIQSEREARIVAGLLRGIVLAPARTADGLAAKARILKTIHAHDTDAPGAILTAMVDGHDAALADGQVVDWRDALALSLAIDAATLGQAAPTASNERSVA